MLLAERELKAISFLLGLNPNRYVLEETTFDSGYKMMVLKDKKLNEYVSSKIIKNKEDKITNLISNKGWN
jgi:hypothetical protein